MAIRSSDRSTNTTLVPSTYCQDKALQNTETGVVLPPLAPSVPYSVKRNNCYISQPPRQLAQRQQRRQQNFKRSTFIRTFGYNSLSSLSFAQLRYLISVIPNSQFYRENVELLRRISSSCFRTRLQFQQNSGLHSIN